jgi:hypothetical protein
MKIAIRGGHNYQATGAAALINEVEENRKVYPEVIAYLSSLGHAVIDVTPGNMDKDSDLAYGVNKAKEFGAELFVSIHFNANYSSFEGALGTEVWVNPSNQNTSTIGQRITVNLSKLGFKNRGIKNGSERGLYEIVKTTMDAIIVEVCFVEATEDVALYKRLGVSVIAKGIVEGVTGQEIRAIPGDFNEAFYLYANPDVKAAVNQGIFKNGTAHYLEFGYKDKIVRIYKPTLPLDFKENIYLELNSDLKKAVDNKEIPSGAWHWLTQGWTENNRTYKYDSNPPKFYEIEITDPEEKIKTPIIGNSIATAEQMATFLLKTNPSPKLNGMNVLEFCKLYLEEGATEGIRGDIAFCQTIHETGWLVFTGDVVPEQMNYAGIGTVGGGVKGHYFSSQREGVRAQIQHLKAYATTEALKQECVDPRYGLVTKGIAPTWEDLSGKWAVPGFNSKLYKSLQEAAIDGQTYGQLILKLYNALLNTKVNPELLEPWQPVTNEPKPRDIKAEILQILDNMENEKEQIKILLSEI